MVHKTGTQILFIFLFTFSTLFAGTDSEISRLISWNPVTLDINGNPESIIYYYIYCDETPLLESTAEYFLAATVESNFRHYDDRYLNPDLRLYYLVTAVDEYGNESLGTMDSSLPVELFAFNVCEQNGKIVLTWTTQSEKDNLGFNLYKSSEKNSPFEKINPYLIKGAGNSTTKTDYSYTDLSVQPFQVYYYMLESVNINGTKTRHESKNIYVTGGKPDRYVLTQNYPNPFNPQTTIDYAIPEYSFVQITIYNTRGEEIRKLVNTYQSSGLYTISWDGHDTFGGKVSSGIYYYRLKTNNFSEIKKMIYTK
ncbi:T9SS type A sorting domain-containing protein [candidate division KSB1 bacterium]|nr:T9SS type A sorting domain-containing protein [candidate division KSB1 bacterium]